MKSYTSKIVLCLLPVVLAAFVVGWAWKQYDKGRGGFRLGVDLSGGTILVYQVDATKISPEDLRNLKTEDLAAALKRRVDPADLYNVTIRPVGGEPPRVEIVLPTGGQHQAKAEQDQWTALLRDVASKYPVEGKTDPYADVRKGEVKQLTDLVHETHKDVPVGEISAFIQQHWDLGGDGRRQLTTEEVENIKNLIAQQGRLEFRILANTEDDQSNEAIQRAKAYMADPANRDELLRKATLGEPPPPPRPEGGGTTFPVTIRNETTYHPYNWAEIGKEELYQLGLNSDALAKGGPVADEVNKYKDKEAFLYQGSLVYCRTIPNPDNPDRLPPRDKALGKTVEWFILTRNPESGKDITGDLLAGAHQGFSDRGNGLAVDFSFKPEGANRFYELTYRNRPAAKDENAFHRRLAIILDNVVRSAPRLNEAIRDRGQITGQFTQRAIQDLVTILRAGALPATLISQPVSENSMGPTLGQDTINKGTTSVGFAFLAVLIFMIIYYRFAGIVACVALMANLLLTVAFMVLVNATFTLPGLAGLVLMLGMAVDANVLIYERLREERERGASLALALRNGYDRAFPTIIDTHLSSIFTAIVLYVVGNDQLKGFGISLTVGLIISLFTSLYMTRTMFGLWQARGWLRNLRFMQLFHRPNINFMAIRYYWFTATIILTILGAGLFIWRGTSGLNIDFTGGTAYTVRLKQPLDIDTVRDRVEKPVAGEQPLPDIAIEQIFVNEPGLAEGNKSVFYNIRTSEKDRQKVLQNINERLGNDLKRINLKVVSVAKDNKSADLAFTDPDTGEEVGASRAQVQGFLAKEFEKYDLGGKQFSLRPAAQGRENSQGLLTKMRLEFQDPVNRGRLEEALANAAEQFGRNPQPERLENFDSQLALDTQQRALYAILASWAAILLYLWFRFGSWTFGAAAVLCLIHDLFFTLGVIAACHYVYATWLGHVLGLQDFKIDLPAIAALLTLVGYSVNDTIVVFDRIREVRGKNPLLTAQMINDSVNQTLSRTVLASLTVWVVVVVLYLFGGEGVHLFGFVMIVGVIVGTYSSIYIASPLLLIFGEGAPARERARAPQPVPSRLNEAPQMTVPSGTAVPRGMTTMPSRMT